MIITLDSHQRKMRSWGRDITIKVESDDIATIASQLKLVDPVVREEIKKHLCITVIVGAMVPRRRRGWKGPILPRRCPLFQDSS